MGKTLGIIQARTGSTRLPEKVLLDLAGRSVLRWVLDRASRSETLDGLIVATSTAVEDDQIADLCKRWGVNVFRGSEDDVLSRFHEAAKAFEAETIVRINSDSPLIDPVYVDKLVIDAQETSAEYSSYRVSDGQPVMLTAIGFFAELMTWACLDRADKIITDPFEREHVTLGIYSRPEEFNVRFLNVPGFCNDLSIRLTLDLQKDLDLLREMFAKLGDSAKTVGANEVVQLLDSHPDWRRKMVELNTLNPKLNKQE